MKEKISVEDASFQGYETILYALESAARDGYVSLLYVPILATEIYKAQAEHGQDLLDNYDVSGVIESATQVSNHQEENEHWIESLSWKRPTTNICDND